MDWEEKVVMDWQAYQFGLKNDLSELRALHRHLHEWAENIGLSADAVARINVCLDELFTNIVSYGFEDNLEHTIKFILNGDNHVVTINIVDDGIPFNPLAKADPELPVNIESAKIGGLGIRIIKELMDRVFYEREQCSNKLTIKMFVWQ